MLELFCRNQCGVTMLSVNRITAIALFSVLGLATTSAAKEYSDGVKRMIAVMNSQPEKDEFVKQVDNSEICQDKNSFSALITGISAFALGFIAGAWLIANKNNTKNIRYGLKSDSSLWY